MTIIVDNRAPLPADWSVYIPTKPLTWLAKYGMTGDDVRKNGFVWSESEELLVMPVVKDGTITGWQGRNFKTKTVDVNKELDGNDLKIGTKEVQDGPKYITKGRVTDHLHIIYPATSQYWNNVDDHRHTLIITEGILDAIKVGRVCNAAPLCGSHMALGLITEAATRFKRLGIWLDPDKRVASVKTALRASQFMPSFVVTSERDPKEYGVNEIYEFIHEAGSGVIPKEGT